MSETPKTVEDPIIEKVRLLKKTELFTGNNDMDRLGQKQSMLLVMAGAKPLSEVTTGRWVVTPTGRKSVAEDPQVVAAFLDSLGLRYSIVQTENATDVVVSLSQDLVDEYRSIDVDMARVGKLFGYPDTATEAFAKQEPLLSFAEQDELVRAAGLPEGMPQFRLSKGNYLAELEILKLWHATLAQYGLAE